MYLVIILFKFHKGESLVEKYDEYKFKSFLWRLELKEAVNYLSNFPEMNDLYQKYISVFEKGEYLKRTDNEVIGHIDMIYQKYYRNVFWKALNKFEAMKTLFQELFEYLKLDKTIVKIEDTEERVVSLVNKEGYECLCGETQGFFGPYIWKDSTKETFEVELPEGTENYTIVMMDGFISRSWLDFISFGKTGAGGWTRKDGLLSCVRKVYDITSDSFKISFLKHEAQHSYDIKKYPKITSVELEYRAKLVELIYWPNGKIIKFIHNEANNSNKDNTHAYSAYLIIRDLSKRIFELDYIPDYVKWEDKINEIQKYSLELLKISSKKLQLEN